jgi:hypothetical protein
MFHPDTPFGLLYEPPQNAVLWQCGTKGFVFFRGKSFFRDRRGVLTDADQDFNNWPTRADFFNAVKRVKAERPAGWDA